MSEAIAMKPQEPYTLDELYQKAEEIYRRDLRPKVMPQHKGEFLIVDVDSGDYELDEDDLAAEERLRARRAEGAFFGIRIGYKEAYSLAGPLEEEDE